MKKSGVVVTPRTCRPPGALGVRFAGPRTHTPGGSPPQTSQCTSDIVARQPDVEPGPSVGLLYSPDVGKGERSHARPPDPPILHDTEQKGTN